MNKTIKNKTYSTDDASKIGTMIFFGDLAIHVGVLYLKEDGEYFLHFKDVTLGWDNPKTAIFPQASKEFKHFFMGINGESNFNSFIDNCTDSSEDDPILFTFNKYFVEGMYNALFSK